MTALGGGTVRDVLLGHYPLGWIAHPEYLVITLVAATVASWAARHVTRMKTLFVTVDAIGLAAFTIIGCDVGASTGTAPIIVVLAGAITGVCGGMLRDLLQRDAADPARGAVCERRVRHGGHVGMQHLGVDAGIATVVALAAGFRCGCSPCGSAGRCGRSARRISSIERGGAPFARRWATAMSAGAFE